ncbi:hypothetical protein QCA50_004921 [Cerrena zonata]|uniref:Uncharacterized protein n=1 Tax=Cerrena zonata TaxID=2478898 RepID=A0AAW0GFY4_9APHY
MHRTPFWPGEPNEPSPIIVHWNKTLREYASQFMATHPDANVFVWSSYELFNKILDDPKKYGLEEEDRKRMGGSIWFDHIHPTTKVHKEIARDMVAFLEATQSNAE